MAKILQGILGAASGKVAGVVAGSWKNINYIRGYAKPANPNTTLQQAQRTKFSSCVNFAKLWIGQVFNTYTDKFLKGMSGFNYFISRNIDIFDGTPDYEAIKLTEGKLAIPVISGVVADASDHSCVITYSTAPGNNGDALDKIYAAVYNETTGLCYFPAAEVVRGTGSISTSCYCTAGDNVVAYLWAIKYQNTTVEMISNSSAMEVTAQA
jgi:hypothetical protein